MYKYITMNGDVYVKTERVTFRRAIEIIVAKCQHLYISAYNFIRVLGGI